MLSLLQMDTFKNALFALIRAGSIFYTNQMPKMDTVSPTTSTPTPTVSNARPKPVTLWTPPEEPQDTITQVIRELPAGAVQTWEGVTLLVNSSTKPIYLFVVEIDKKNTLLQFKEPKNHLTMRGDQMLYSTGETVCHRKFFNRSFLPTFFVFDNYLHAYAFEQKLVRVGWNVQKQKFK
jgi:hypothetical protein